MLGLAFAGLFIVVVRVAEGHCSARSHISTKHTFTKQTSQTHSYVLFETFTIYLHYNYL